jgi:hypothetical protein
MPGLGANPARNLIWSEVSREFLASESVWRRADGAAHLPSIHHLSHARRHITHRGSTRSRRLGGRPSPNRNRRMTSPPTLVTARFDEQERHRLEQAVGPVEIAGFGGNGTIMPGAELRRRIRIVERLVLEFEQVDEAVLSAGEHLKSLLAAAMSRPPVSTSGSPPNVASPCCSLPDAVPSPWRVHLRSHSFGGARHRRRTPRPALHRPIHRPDPD